MSRKVLVFEPKKCVGCRLCEQTCSMTHFGVTNPTKARIRIVRDHESQLDVATYCHQCINAPCIKACKFDALSRVPDTHAILVNEEKCVGCRMCIEKCPYAAPTMHPSRKLVLICNLCGGKPACVNICPENAVQYLELEKAANIRRSIYVEEETQKIKSGVEKIE